MQIFYYCLTKIFLSLTKQTLNFVQKISLISPFNFQKYFYKKLNLSNEKSVNSGHFSSTYALFHLIKPNETSGLDFGLDKPYGV